MKKKKEKKSQKKRKEKKRNQLSRSQLTSLVYLNAFEIITIYSSHSLNSSAKELRGGFTIIVLPGQCGEKECQLPFQ